MIAACYAVVAFLINCTAHWMASISSVATFEADVDYLPLQQSCLDCAVLIHALVFTRQPELVLSKNCVGP